MIYNCADPTRVRLSRDTRQRYANTIETHLFIVYLHRSYCLSVRYLYRSYCLIYTASITFNIQKNYTFTGTAIFGKFSNARHLVIFFTQKLILFFNDIIYKPTCTYYKLRSPSILCPALRRNLDRFRWSFLDPIRFIP